MLTVSRGEIIVFETRDGYGGRLTDDPKTHRWAGTEERSPITGPVFIDGAEVGDVLCVHIQQIQLAGSGVAVLRPGAGMLGRDIRRTTVRFVPIKRKQAELAKGVVVPVHPVVGAVGVAARHGEISTRYPGRHGGNMDTRDLTIGTRVYLPVQVKGALLGIGNVKACMGDGETSGTGVEIAAEVTVRVDTLPGGWFSWPRLEHSEACVTIASASSVEQAARLAVMEMIRWLEQDKGLDFETAYMLVGAAGDLRISQWVNPLVTARVVFPKAIMSRLPHEPHRGSRLVVTDAPALLPLPSDTEPGAEIPSGQPSPASTDAHGAGDARDEATPDKKEAPPKPSRPRRRRRRSTKKTSAPPETTGESAETGTDGQVEPATAPEDASGASSDATGASRADTGAKPSAWRGRRRRRSGRPGPAKTAEKNTAPETAEAVPPGEASAPATASSPGDGTPVQETRDAGAPSKPPPRRRRRRGGRRSSPQAGTTAEAPEGNDTRREEDVRGKEGTDQPPS